MQCNCSHPYAKLDPVIDHYKNIPGSLITVLQKAQEQFGYLPAELMDYIAKGMNTKSSVIYGVATFYTQFRLTPVGKNVISLCQGTACHVNGSSAIYETIQNELGITDGQTTNDGLFTLSNVACLGCCSLSPVMMINGETYGKLTPDSTRKILKEIQAHKEAEA